jgi:hypothetical protein
LSRERSPHCWRYSTAQGAPVVARRGEPLFADLVVPFSDCPGSLYVLTEKDRSAPEESRGGPIDSRRLRPVPPPDCARERRKRVANLATHLEVFSVQQAHRITSPCFSWSDRYLGSAAPVSARPASWGCRTLQRCADQQRRRSVCGAVQLVIGRVFARFSDWKERPKMSTTNNTTHDPDRSPPMKRF